MANASFLSSQLTSRGVPDNNRDARLPAQRRKARLITWIRRSSLPMFVHRTFRKSLYPPSTPSMSETPSLRQAMYPTIVIVLVNSRRSFVDTYGFSSAWNEGKGMVHSHRSRPPTVGHLSFAASPPTEGIVHLEDNPGAVEKREAASVKGRNEGHDQHAVTAHF